MTRPETPQGVPTDTAADAYASALWPLLEPPEAPREHPQAPVPDTLARRLDAAVVRAAERLRDALQRWSTDLERRQRERRERRRRDLGY